MEGESLLRYPIRKIFAGCCASAITPTASSTETTRIDDQPALCIAHLVLEAITHAVVVKRIIRQKQNQIRRGGKCAPGNTQEIELNHASVKTRWILNPVRLSISWNLRMYLSRVRELSVSQASHPLVQSPWTTTFEELPRRDEQPTVASLKSGRDARVSPLSEEAKGGLPTGPRGKGRRLRLGIAFFAYKHKKATPPGLRE